MVRRAEKRVHINRASLRGGRYRKTEVCGDREIGRITTIAPSGDSYWGAVNTNRFPHPHAGAERASGSETAPPRISVSSAPPGSGAALRSAPACGRGVHCSTWRGGARGLRAEGGRVNLRG